MSKILKDLILEFENREQRGLKKYGTTMDREDLSLQEWLQHFKEELMDGLLYLQKLQILINDAQRYSDYQEANSTTDGSINSLGKTEYPRASL